MSQANKGKSGLEATFFALRTPLLPFAELGRLTGELATPTALREAGDRLDAERKHLQRAVEQDRERIRARMRELLGNPLVREAIFVASPDLSATLAEWERQPAGADGTADKEL